MKQDRTLLVAAAAAAAALGLLAWGVTHAGAGAYRVAQCHPALGAGHADAAFERSSEHYRADARCDEPAGLGVVHDAASTPRGRFGAWTLRAPDGARIVRLRASVRGRARDGHAPELLARSLTGEWTPIAPPGPEFRARTWRGAPAAAVRARLRCARRTGCGAGHRAEVRVRRIMLGLRDQEPPVVGLGGSLLVPGSRRGAEQVAAVAGDAGGGVRRLITQVNGRTVDATMLDCALRSGIALRLAPCPAHAAVVTALDTGQAPFRQGSNALRVCGRDFAAGRGANHVCETRHVRVDNACPISGDGRGSRLRVRVLGDSRVRRGERVALGGRLLGRSGTGVEGARVCVATRILLPGAPERVVATTVTGPDGSFRAPLPSGPSRQLRVADWPDGERAVERFLRLDVEAHPGLRLLPGRALHNGDRLRFAARAHGPRAAGREVRIEVAAGGRWLTLRAGHANAHGVYRSSYRFRATTGRRTYRFRALVPRQRGYPYLAGRSAVRRQVVVGG